MTSIEDSEPTFSSINSLNTNDDDEALNEGHDDDDVINNEDKDHLICEINLNADSYRLCKAKAAYAVVLGKIDASLVKKKTLIATEAPHFDTKSLIAKLDDVAKTIDLDVSTILAEQIEDPVLGTVSSRIRKGTSAEPKSPEIQQSKRFL